MKKSDEEILSRVAAKEGAQPLVPSPLGHLLPEFIRYPQATSKCAWTCLSRSSLAELVENGKVKAVKLRKVISKRGITLICRKSLLDYLHSLEEQT